MSKSIKWPRWGCSGIGIPVDTKKKFSFSKALVGNTIGAIFGPVTAAIGMANGIHGKMAKQNLYVQNVGKFLNEKYNLIKYGVVHIAGRLFFML